MNEKHSFLETEPIGKLMKKYAIPCIISLLVAALYNIVDQIFIANADYLGSYGNAANTVVYPLTVVALSIATMIGDGCCSFVSICLGAKEDKKASGSVGSAVILSVLSGVVLMVLYFLFQSPLLALFGGTVNSQTLAHSKEYLTWITIGIPFYVFGQAMNPVIRSDGSPKFAMVSTLAGAVLNIILDPLFIFTFHWGMMGAALATILGQILTAVLSVAYLFHMKAVKLTAQSFRLHFSLMKRYLPLGLCSFLSQFSLVLSMAAVNNMIQKYSSLDAIFSMQEYAQIPMAVIGIVMKFFQIVISIVIGMAAGCIPIVGYNIGAARKDRAKELLTKLLIAEACTGVIALILVELFPHQIIAIFGAASESIYYTEFAVKSFRVYLCMMIFACVNKAAFIFLQSMGKPWISTLLSMIREILFGVGLALLLPVWFGLDGVLYSMPVSDALTFLVSLIVLMMTYRELSQDSQKKVASSEENTETSPVIQGHPVIVIGRSFGSGGRSLGKLVAEKLNIPYYDKELISAASENGMNPILLESFDEKPMQAASHNALISDAPFQSVESEAFRSSSETIKTLALQQSCVIVGRRADQILKHESVAVFSVFVSAPMEARIQRVMQRDGISRIDAESKIRKADKERAAYYNSLSDEKWGTAQSYHLCLDTDFLGIEKCADLIVDAVQTRLITSK